MELSKKLMMRSPNWIMFSEEREKNGNLNNRNAVYVMKEEEDGNQVKFHDERNFLQELGQFESGRNHA